MTWMKTNTQIKWPNVSMLPNHDLVNLQIIQTIQLFWKLFSIKDQLYLEENLQTRNSRSEVEKLICRASCPRNRNNGN